MSPTTATKPRHPAPFPRYVLDRLELWLGAERREVGRPLRILDPFAGIGRIHDLPRRLGETVGVEIEPEWANLRKGTIVGDATQLPEAWTATFDAVATSCCYGSRMADHHEAKDSCYVCKGTGTAWTPEGCADVPFVCPECHDIACKCGGHAKALRAHVLACSTCRRAVCKACGGNGLSKRYTYRHALGRPLHERNAGQMQWGDAYRCLHADAWREARRVLAPGGLFLLNVKNHYRGDVEQLVAEWHAAELKRQGFRIQAVQEISATGLRHVGANAERRVECERVIVARAAA